MKAASDFSSDDERPHSWADALPWVAGVSGVRAVPWWEESIADANPLTRNTRLAMISELAMERLTRWTIGQIFPGLAPGIHLQKFNLPTRAANALRRFGGPTTSELIAITLDDIMDWRGVGAGTVDAILQAFADASTVLATPPVMNQRGAESLETPLSPDPESASDAASLPDWLGALGDDLTLIASWYRTVGLHDQALLGDGISPGTTDEIAEARQRLLSLRPNDILGLPASC